MSQVFDNQAIFFIKTDDKLASSPTFTPGITVNTIHKY